MSIKIKLIATFYIGFIVSGNALAGQTAEITKFTSGQTISSSQMNTNFSNVQKALSAMPGARHFNGGTSGTITIPDGITVLSVEAASGGGGGGGYSYDPVYNPSGFVSPYNWPNSGRILSTIVPVKAAEVITVSVGSAGSAGTNAAYGVCGSGTGGKNGGDTRITSSAGWSITILGGPGSSGPYNCDCAGNCVAPTPSPASTPIPIVLAGFSSDQTYTWKWPDSIPDPSATNFPAGASGIQNWNSTPTPAVTTTAGGPGFVTLKWY